MDYEITIAERKDQTEINQLFKTTIKDNFIQENIFDPSHALAEEVIDSLTKSLELYFESKGVKEFFFVAKTADEILGTIAYGAVSPLIYENFEIDRALVPEIKSVYVLPQYQGQGIGSQLFRHCLERLQEKKIEGFCLDSGFKRAQNYWTKKLGKPKLILKDYWSKDSPHMIWQEEVGKY